MSDSGVGSAQAKPTELYVSVLNDKGQSVPGLTAKDFAVREDNVGREILKVEPASEPMTVALLVDDSQAANEGVQMIRDGVHKFINTLSGKADIALITFGERPTILVDYTQDTQKLNARPTASSRGRTPGRTCWTPSSRSARAFRSARRNDP